LANFVQFIRMLMFCLEDWKAWPNPAPTPLGYVTGFTRSKQWFTIRLKR